jgi:hypothetical protein
MVHCRDLGELIEIAGADNRVGNAPVPEVVNVVPPVFWTVTTALRTSPEPDGK